MEFYHSLITVNYGWNVKQEEDDEIMKKTMIALLGGVAILGGTSPVSAEVDTPMTTSFELYGQFNIIKGQELVWGWSSYQKPELIDLSNGERIQSLPNVDSSIDGFDASDDKSLRVAISEGSIHVYDAFGSKIKEISTILNKEEEISDFVEVQFIPDTHTVILLAENSGDGKMLSFDLDSEQLLSVRGTSQFGQILTARDHVAIISSSDANVYTSNLSYKGVIHGKEEESIEAFDMNDDGLLIIGENNTPQLDVYDLNRGFRKIQTSGQFVTGKDMSYNDISIDESGTFIAVTSYGSGRPFSLFERETGRRVHTSLDYDRDIAYQSKIELSNEARSIVVEGYSSTNVYSGKELYKRLVAIQVPAAHQSVDSGSSETLALEVTRADGKTVLVKSGVSWATDNPTKAYIKSGKLYGKTQGSYTLKATYEGFTTTVTGKVMPPPKLSSLKDVPWLERHRQSLLDKQSFEGLPVLASSYSKLKGTKGSMFIPETDANTNGKWKGSVLASRYVRYGESQPNRIELLTMLPALEKRSISKAEIKSAFGKPVTSETYSSSVPRHFSKSNKTFAKYSVKSYYEYQLKNLSVEVCFDKQDNVKFITVSKR